MDINYKASPTFKLVHRDTNDVIGVRGPVGSGKSVGCVNHMLLVAMNQAQASDGVRYTRWVCVRNTYPELKATVIKTFQEWIPEEVCPIVYNSPIFGLLDIEHPDGETRIHCEFYFLSLDKPKDVQKLMSFEMTGIWINEAQFLNKAIVTEAVSRATQARYPTASKGYPTWCGVIMDTNSPDDDHWWYELEKGVDEYGEPKKPSNWSFYEQPGALIEITNIPHDALSPEIKANIEKGWFRDIQGKRFVANPLAENVRHDNKGYSAWFDQLGGASLNWIRSRICNQFVTVADGRPVYGDHFNRELHVAKQKLLPVKGWRTIVGIDFGLTPSAIFGQISPIGQLRIVDEIVASGMGAERFIQQDVKPLLAQKYRGCDVEFFGDPAGIARAQSDETTCFQIMEREGLNADAAHTNDLTPRLEAVRGFLSRLIGRGQPAMIISPHCKKLIKGYETGYQYKRLNVSGEERFTEKPDKNSYSHPHDANQYLCLAATPDLERERLITQQTSRTAIDRKTGY